MTGIHRVAITTLIALVASLSTTAARGGPLDPRVQWRVTMEGVATTNYVAVAPDGTIYANNNDRLLALDPDGNVLWDLPNIGQDYARPINVAADGTIYAGGLGTGQVTALNPDGSLLWAYTPASGSGLLAGPSLGPDGALYAIANNLGTYSLDADGNLRWIGEYEISTSYNNAPLRFDAERFFAGIDHSGAFPSLHVYGLADGLEIWGSGSAGIPWGGYPTLGAAGEVLGRRWPTWIQSLAPADGEVQWFSHHPGNPQSLTWPAVAPDGAVYSGDIFGMELWAVEPDGTTRWVLGEETGSIMQVRVAPDNATVVTTGRIDLGYLRGYDPADGALLWHVDLPDESDMPQYVSAFEVVFSPDGRTAYVATNFAGGAVQHGYLYAVTLGDPQIFADGFESGDTSAWSTTVP
ncbi:MAG: PQQ-binding-like beta-propeller repeat protein [Acidobacteriota bacterium]|nr:PQQ-binding-like beta-propeller repeat protein [Acidobacteriota bacterium]